MSDSDEGDGNDSDDDQALEDDEEEEEEGDHEGGDDEESDEEGDDEDKKPSNTVIAVGTEVIYYEEDTIFGAKVLGHDESTQMYQISFWDMMTREVLGEKEVARSTLKIKPVPKDEKRQIAAKKAKKRKEAKRERKRKRRLKRLRRIRRRKARAKLAPPKLMVEYEDEMVSVVMSLGEHKRRRDELSRYQDLGAKKSLHFAKPPTEVIHGQPEPMAVCQVCYESLSMDTYCEYRYVGYDSWIPAHLCATCLQKSLQTQWAEFQERWADTDCPDIRRRLLKDGPPIFVREPLRMPVPPTRDVVQLWFAQTNMVISARLEGTPVGAGLVEWWLSPEVTQYLWSQSEALKILYDWYRRYDPGSMPFNVSGSVHVSKQMMLQASMNKSQKLQREKEHAMAMAKARREFTARGIASRRSNATSSNAKSSSGNSPSMRSLGVSPLRSSSALRAASAASSSRIMFAPHSRGNPSSSSSSNNNKAKAYRGSGSTPFVLSRRSGRKKGQRGMRLKSAGKLKERKGKGASRAPLSSPLARTRARAKARVAAGGGSSSSSMRDGIVCGNGNNDNDRGGINGINGGNSPQSRQRRQHSHDTFGGGGGATKADRGNTKGRKGNNPAGENATTNPLGGRKSSWRSLPLGNQGVAKGRSTLRKRIGLQQQLMLRRRQERDAARQKQQSSKVLAMAHSDPSRRPAPATSAAAAALHSDRLPPRGKYKRIGSAPSRRHRGGSVASSHSTKLTSHRTHRGWSPSACAMSTTSTKTNHTAGSSRMLRPRSDQLTMPRAAPQLVDVDQPGLLDLRGGRIPEFKSGSRGRWDGQSLSKSSIGDFSSSKSKKLSWHRKQKGKQKMGRRAHDYLASAS